MAGRPPYVPTEEGSDKVKRYAAVGIPHEDIAKVIGIDKKTLEKHYREELDLSATMANAAVGGALYNKAIQGDTTAMIWWTKTRMKWKEQIDHNHDGEININVSLEEAIREGQRRVEEAAKAIPAEYTEVEESQEIH